MTALASVITTIQSPTSAVTQLLSVLRPLQSPLIAIGDRKGPANFEAEGAVFHDLQSQLVSRFDFGRRGPAGHYTRKNIGYLEAVAIGANCIYETDDDNAPLPIWHAREERVRARPVRERGWVNAYRLFSEERIWPRGLPLDEIVASFVRQVDVQAAEESVRAPIQQGLANGSPDVDAVWRLVFDHPFVFDVRPSIVLAPGAWCPFNSQSTWWWPVAYPLMYLPSFCSFRMTDIWRSFVAQRCLWELGMGVVFHGAEVLQDRNVHNLMRDFSDELPGYQRNRELVEVLADTTLLPGETSVAENLRRCYIALMAREFFSGDELGLLDCWLRDLELARCG